jgi:SAM-dependent methyltransferase
MNEIEPRTLRRAIGALPVIGPAAKRLYRAIAPVTSEPVFGSSPQYWDARYRLGRNSGDGSYGRLAEFKAETINRFVAERGIGTVIEFGSGDGAQLQLAKYPSYVGIDVSPRAVETCRAKFADDPSKQFFHTSTREANALRADLAMSLDVIYHLVEDEVYDAYMARLVASALQFICIYSSNVEKAAPEPHIRHRRFTDWIAQHAPAWTLVAEAPNPYPEDPQRPNDTSWANFYFFAKSPAEQGI